MNWYAVLTILILLVIADGIAAIFGFRSSLYVYRKEGVSAYTRRLSLFLALLMFALALVGLSEIVNTLIHSQVAESRPRSYQIQAVVTRVIRSIPTWLVAWQLTKAPTIKIKVPILPK